MKNRLRRSFTAFIAGLFIIGAPTQHAQAAAELPSSFADLVQNLTPAVVNISTTQKIHAKQGMPVFPFKDLPPGSGMEQFRDFFERYGQGNGQGNGEMPNNKDGDRNVYSLGSGFIIDPSGYVVTNNHVIADAEEVTVLMSDDSKYKAKIIGRDSKTDLALLKIDAKKSLPFVKFGNSDESRVGDWVITIGNPFGLGGSVTAGIISARARNINSGPFDDFIQTDAAINRGNSGGPMFNTKGEVIGINSAIFSPSGGNIGIGFAVPSSLARPVIDQLKEYGRTHRGWLGVKIQEVTEEAAESRGLPNAGGALVVDITKDSPAIKAGIKVGDIILSFDGKDIKEMRMLPRIVADTKIGKQVNVVVWRDNARHTLVITLGEMKEDESTDETGDNEPSAPQNVESREVLGMNLAPLTDELREQYGVDKATKGLLVVNVKADSAAAKNDVRYGDVIIQVNDTEIRTVDQLNTAVKAAREARRKNMLVRIIRSGEGIFLTLPTDSK